MGMLGVAMAEADGSVRAGEPDDVAAVDTERLHLTVGSPLPWVRLVTVAGDLDAISEPLLVECLHEVLASNPHDVVVDLTEVTFVDCAGCRALAIGADISARFGVGFQITGGVQRA